MILVPHKASILRIAFLAALFFMMLISALAQPVRYEIEQVPFSKEIPGFAGSSMLQDSEGFMWFGTEHGLFRYDGADFKQFMADPADSTSICNESVLDILEDDEGFLWFATEWGLSKYDKRTASFTSFKNEGMNNYRCVHEDESGYLWLGTAVGLHRFNKLTGVFTNYKMDPRPWGLNRVWHIYEDRSGKLWLQYGNDGMALFNRDTESFEFIEETPCDLNFFHEDRSGRFWVTSYDGLYLFDRETHTFLRKLNNPDDPGRLKNQAVKSIIEDREGSLWIRTFDGIYRYNQNLELLYYMVHSHLYTHTMDYYYITNCMVQDHSGTIWFYTREGISKIVNNHANFRVYNPDATTHTLVMCLHVENKNTVWFSDGSGVTKYDRQNNVYTSQYLEPELAGDRAYRYVVQALHVDSSGVFWFGTNGRGLFRGTKREDGMLDFERVDLQLGDSIRLQEVLINKLFEDSGGRLWIGIKGQLPCFYDRKSGQVMHLLNNPASTDQLLKGRPVILEPDPGTLLAANDGAIYIIRPPFAPASEHRVMASDVIKVRKHGDAPLRGKTLFRQSKDTTGTIWTLSWNNGLGKLVPVYGLDAKDILVETKIYSMKHGLPSNSLSTVLEDGQGKLWLGSEGGLSRFDPESETFTNFYTRHGLPINAMFRPAFKCDDGEMFFGTRKGIISFYPDSIRGNEIVPPVLLTDLKVNNKSLSPQVYLGDAKGDAGKAKLELTYRQNNLYFQFAALNYIRPNLNQYQYMLEGLNDDWVIAGNRNSIEFANLDPGKYTFRVVGSNNDGLWNEEGASVAIWIHFPPWRTWWAFLVYAFILSVIIFIYRSYLINRAKLRTAIEVERIEKEKVSELDHMKSRFFANISHEFRTPLTLISGPIDQLGKDLPDMPEKSRKLLQTMKRNAGRLQNLINQLLDISKVDAGKFKLQVAAGNLEECVRTISLSFLSLAESKGISYSHDLPGTSPHVYFDSDKVQKILTNLLSNAFKFTEAGEKIRVSLQYLPESSNQLTEFVSITVSDTGSGIPLDKQKHIFDRFYQVNDSNNGDVKGSGIGLALTKELVELYRGEISVESEQGKGSSFTVKLPVSVRKFTKEELASEPKENGFDTISDKLSQDYPESKSIDSENDPLKNEADNLPVVLVVEDNADLRNYITQSLGGSYIILTAENGKAGLEQAFERLPDLILSDVMMPGMDGMEMCGKLKGDERTDHIPVIMLTARADKGSKLDGLESGADDYIIKPFDPEELQVRIKNLLEQRRRLREKFRKEFAKDFSGEEGSAQAQFIRKLNEILNQHISEPEFTIDQLASELHMSRSQAYRKLTAITDYAPNEYIRNIRLKKAAYLFRSGHHHVAQVMHQVGFNNQSYFSKCFSEQYGIPPKKYIIQYDR